jgi:Thiol-disulfide isomerase and thioredoxins
MSFFRRTFLVLTLFSSSLPAAFESWTAPDGSPMQAELLSAKNGYVSFRKADGRRLIFPLAQLTPADRERIAILTGALPPEPAPTPASTTVQRTSAPAKSEPSPLADALYGKLVGVRDGMVDTLALDHLTGTDAIAVYYSASWCGPCRRFTPQLVAAYHEIKARHPEFEIVFVSADRDERSMKRYMLDANMPWAALRYSDTRRDHPLSVYRESGIPNLVFIDRQGRVLSKSFDAHGNYLGPQKVLADIRKHFRL